MLARVEASEVVAAAYGGSAPVFGPEYIIPKAVRPAPDPADRPRRRPGRHGGRASQRARSRDFAAYRRELEVFVYRSGQLMRPVFEAARKSPRRIVYADGRGRAGAARRANHRRRGHRATHPDWPAWRDRLPRGRNGIAAEPGPERARAGPGSRPGGVRPADRGLPAPRRAARSPGGCGGAADAQPGNGGCLDAAACRGWRTRPSWAVRAIGSAI